MSWHFPYFSPVLFSRTRQEVGASNIGASSQIPTRVRWLIFVVFFIRFFPLLLIISPELIKRQLMWLWETVSLWLSTGNSLASNESDKSFVGTLALLALLLPWRDGIGNPTHLPVKANILRKLIQIWDLRVGGVQLCCPPFTTSKKAKSVPFNLFFFKRIHPFYFLRDLTVSHDAVELPCWKTQTA